MKGAIERERIVQEKGSGRYSEHGVDMASHLLHQKLIILLDHSFGGISVSVQELTMRDHLQGSIVTDGLRIAYGKGRLFYTSVSTCS